MIRHQPFFEALGTLDPSDIGWNPLLSGLATLRVIDSIDEGRLEGENLHDAVAATRSVATSISEGDAARAILLRISDLLASGSGIDAALAVELLAYGKSLDLEARWSLAADVFQTIAELARSRRDADILIDSLTSLGAAARNTGDWDLSDHSYAEAQYLADSIGDVARSLTAQIGIANSHVARGNLPAADSELQAVLAAAGKQRMEQVEALALHAKAYLAITEGLFQRAIHYAYRSLELTTNETARDRILGDIAAAYAGLGLVETARDGYSIVAVTSPHQWVRWQATLNLMELAIDQADEKAFDNFLVTMERETLEPRLKVYLMWFKARGFRVFARPRWEELYDAANGEAIRYRLHQLAFQVEAEKESEQVPALGQASEHTSTIAKAADLQSIAEVLMHLREEVVGSVSGR